MNVLKTNAGIKIKSCADKIVDMSLEIKWLSHWLSDLSQPVSTPILRSLLAVDCVMFWYYYGRSLVFILNKTVDAYIKVGKLDTCCIIEIATRFIFIVISRTYFSLACCYFISFLLHVCILQKHSFCVSLDTLF